MFSRSVPSVLKSRSRPPQHRAAGDSGLKMSVEATPSRAREGQAAVVVRIVDVDRAVEETAGDFVRLRVDGRLSVAVAADLDLTVVVEVDAVLELQREEEQPTGQVRLVDGARRARDARQVDRDRERQLRCIRVARRLRDEVEAVLDADSEAEVHREIDVQLRRELRRDAERRNAEVQIDRRGRERPVVAEAEVELHGVGGEDVDAAAGRRAEEVAPVVLSAPTRLIEKNGEL